MSITILRFAKTVNVVGLKKIGAILSIALRSGVHPIFCVF